LKDFNVGDMNFNYHKEEAIKELSCQIGEIFNKISEDHLVEEVIRRRSFRSYVDRMKPASIESLSGPSFI
jgi:hypothetical protein